jgi:multicomponent Na+:H+ antiporter subunit E
VDDLSDVRKRRQSLKRFFRRLLPLAALWWLFAGEDGFSWLFGGPVIVILAAWRLNQTGGEAGGLRPGRLVRFVPFFVWRSVLGSCDVAWRAMHRRLPIAPVLHNYPLHLPAGSPARVFFANSLNLLPGTLMASWTGDVLQVHLLADPDRAVLRLRQLEDRVAFLFGHECPGQEEERGA